MDYELYHDESLEGGYWHGMLLVPAWNKKEFLDLLVTARNNTRYYDKIGIKKVDLQGLIYYCALAWTQIGDDCQCLQLTDLLIGCFRTSLGYKTREIHARIARPVKNLVDMYYEGDWRMKKSRWSKAFFISQCYLENGKWIFEGIQRNQNEAKQPKML